MTSDKSSQWWRWPLMPFAAVIGALLGTLLITGFNWLGMKMAGFSENGWWYLYIRPLIQAGLFGGIYSWIAYSIVPRGGLIASTVMSTILGVLAVIVLWFAWNATQATVGSRIGDTIYTIALIAGCVVGLRMAHDEEKSERATARNIDELLKEAGNVGRGPLVLETEPDQSSKGVGPGVNLRA